MENLAREIAQKNVEEGCVSAWSLGGSGFVFKAPGGVQVFIDPYLSNAVGEHFGLHRAFAPPLAPEEARPDIVISTHWHEDHLDVGTLPIIAQCSPQTQFVMPPSALPFAASWGIPIDRIRQISWGETLEIGGVKIEAVPARHESGTPGQEVPDAFGAVMEIGGRKIYHCGDTEYDLRLRALKTRAFDVGIFCINGVSGNMDAHEAALLAWQLGAKTVLPMHYHLWDRDPSGGAATLDPQLFAETYRKLGGVGRVITPEVGQEMQF